jgi:hypothetical protein
MPVPPEEAMLQRLRSLLEQLRPLLETRLMIMTQEMEHGLTEGVSVHFAKQRYTYLCWVLAHNPRLEVALRVCSALALDLNDFAHESEAHVPLRQAFLALFEEQGYSVTQGLLWIPDDNLDLLPDFYSQCDES